MKEKRWAMIAIFVVMFAFPWAAVTFAPGDAGMAICFLLFFGVNILESLCIGIFSGRAAKQRWYLPAVNALAFQLGTWTVFDWGNPDFYGYTMSYLALALLSMLITIVVFRKKRNNH